MIRLRSISFRILVIALEGVMYALLVLMLYFLLSFSYHSIEHKYLELRSSDALKIRMFVENYLDKARDEFVFFAETPESERSPAFRRMLGTLSEIYLLDETMSVVEIYKASQIRRVFPGFSFEGGELGEFVRQAKFSLSSSAIMKAVEDEQASIYLSMRSEGGIYLARVNLQRLAKSVSRIAEVSDTPVFFVSSDGFVYMTTHPDFHLYSLKPSEYRLGLDKNSVIKAGGRSWLPVFSEPSDLFKSSLSVLFSVDILVDIKNYHDRFFWIFSVILFLVSALKLYHLGFRILRPLVRFSDALKEAESGRYEPLGFKNRPAGSLEMHRLYTSFNQMTEAIQLRESELSSSEQRSRQEKERLMVTLKSIGDGVIVTDAEGCVELLNDVAETLTEWTTEMARGRPVAEVFTIRDCETMEEIVNFFESDSVESQASSLSRKAVLVSKSGTEYQIEDSLSRIQDEKGHLLGRVLVFRDVSGEVLMREQLLQTQKMESIGRLAGGVAHDFNNMLAVIMNSAELLQLDKALTPKSRNFVENILASAQRSADLTAKLLSFARKGKRLTRQIDLRALTESSVVLLKGTADKRIAIRLLDHEKNAYVQGDESQIQSVLMNLGINAVHAMPEGGELVFEIDECYLDKHYCQVSAFSIEPGRYVKVMVRDTGTGIARQDQNKIFEPFYSTKGQKGTGLGLSAALGAVIEHRGALTFYSEEGTGTVFHLYLPSAEEEKCQDEPELELVKGAGTILLVDDEEMIRQTGKLMLEDLGYDVLLADDGQEAVRIYEEMADQIDLVILDMIMPVMNGRQAFESIRRLNPFCAVMIASGFSREKDLAAMKAMGLAGVLLKPYSRYTLGLILQDFFAGLGAEKQLDKPTGQPSDKSSNKSTDKQVEE